MWFPSILGIHDRSATKINVKKGTGWIKFEKGERDWEEVLSIKKNIKQGRYKKGYLQKRRREGRGLETPCQL